jgi:hypothetical protein
MTVDGIIQAFATIVIGGVATYIAYQQWRTNSRRVKLDLFDRRFRVFDATRNLLGSWYTVGLNDEEYLKFLRETAEADFLFGSEVKEYRDEIYQRVQRWSFANQELKRAMESAGPVEKRTKLAETVRTEIEWATREVNTLPDKFRKYLDMHKL